MKFRKNNWISFPGISIPYLVLYINPFDHPLIWEGHGSVIDELKSDLNGIKPSLIICSVGGGGLLLGILNGLKRNDWNDVPGKNSRIPDNAKNQSESII